LGFFPGEAGQDVFLNDLPSRRVLLEDAAYNFDDDRV
jgi:hypothetical protein